MPTDLDTSRTVQPPSRLRGRVQWAGMVAGPVAAVLAHGLLGEGAATLGPDGRTVAAIGVWMAVWWLTEAVHVSVTALLPIVLLPLTGVMSIAEATAPYANPLIFLFLGGFVLALSMQRWGLDTRIALLTIRLVGDRPAHLVGGFMVATAVMSMWVSNTATVAMMLPIALSVALLVGRLDGDEGRGTDRFTVCLLLAIAYAASIGGMGTLIGTPPNLFVASYVRERVGVDITFARWMLFGVPLVAVFLPFAWWLLTRLLYDLPHTPVPGARRFARERYAALGAASRGEWTTFMVFTITALAWVFQPLLVQLTVAGHQPLEGLTDTGIAVAAALVLFLVPVDVRRRIFVMDWRQAERLPWGVLLLFGGGLSLAHAIEATGVGEWIGAALAGIGVLPTVLLIGLVSLAVVSLTELTSNTATTAAFVPVLAGLAPAIGLDPVLLVVPIALSASAAFMLPVATPPNAIVYGSGQLPLPAMLRAGLLLNVATVALVTVTGTWVVPWALGR